MKNEVIEFVLNADLRCSHEGLSVMLKKTRHIDVSTLEPGQYVVCVNSSKTIVKIYAAGNVIAHYKSPRGQINLKTLRLVPKYFNGRSLNYSGALAEIIRKELRA